MTDLHAPLGRDRPPSKAARSGHHAGVGFWQPRVIGIAAFFALLAVGQSALLLLGDRAPQTALLSLPTLAPQAAVTDTAIQTGSVGPSSNPAEPQVQIVYGDGDGQGAGQVLPPVTHEDGALVSPGGPKIITVRDPAAVRVGQPLQVAHLPEDAALEATDFGELPVRTSDGRRPMDIYARPWSGAGGKRIAIVIGGLGLSQTGTHYAIETLPPDITLAFAPTGNSLNRWMREARSKGHELLLQVPMEPFGYPEIDPGPRTLRLASSPQTNLENLHWALGRLTNYTGVMNHMGARFAATEQAMEPILGDLSERGLLFFNDGTASPPALGPLARSKGVPHVTADAIIDGSQSQADIRAALSALEELASSRGYAIGSGAALRLTVDTVTQWTNEAKKRGFEIVGIAAMAQTIR